MAVTVNVNGLSCIHQTSGGMATATLPDICRTPYGGTPIPYPNVAMSTDLVGGTVTVAVDGSSAAIQSSMFAKSTGDEAGALGGVVSQVFMMEATFLSFSPTVFFEGQPVCRLTDKMLMNKGNTVCMDGALQSPLIDPNSLPPDALETPAPQEPVFCVVNSVFLSCGHGERGLMIDLLAQPLPVLQIISAHDEPDKLIFDADALCGFGHAYCPSLMISPADSIDWKAIDRASGVELPPTLNWPVAVGLIERSLFGTWPCETYKLRPLICNGAGKAEVPINVWTTVEVYHPMEWKGEVTLGWSHPAINEKDPVFAYKEAQAFKIGGSLEGKIGRQSFKLEGDRTRGVKKHRFPLIGSLADKLGRSIFIADMFCKFGDDLKGGIKWPDVKFGGGVELVELTGKPVVANKGSFKLACDPLIGFELKVSLLNLLLRYGGPLLGPGGAALSKILLAVKKQFASDPKSFEMEIDLTISGAIKGGFGGTYEQQEIALDSSATSIDGNIGFQIEGRVQGVAKVVVVEVAGGAKFGLAGAKGEGSEASQIGSKVFPTISDKVITLDGEAYFTGMAFYYLLYGEIGSTVVESEKKDPSPPKQKVAKKCEPIEPEHSVRVSKRFEKKGSYVLMEPWSWKYTMASFSTGDKEQAPASGGGESGAS